MRTRNPSNGKAARTTVGSSSGTKAGAAGVRVIAPGIDTTAQTLRFSSATEFDADDVEIGGSLPWTDVTDTLYGATGDGTTDDTTAIQDAIDALCATGQGGIIYFPAGTYLISSTLTITCDNLALLGDGQLGTIILADPSMAGDDMVEFAGGGGCAVRDMALTSASIKSGGSGIYLNAATDSAVERVYLSHQYDSIKINGGGIIRLRDLSLRDQSRHGIWITGSGNDYYLSQIVADNAVPATGNGIGVDGGCQAIWGENCDFIHFFNGLAMAPSATSTWHFFTGMAFDTNTNDGIHIGDGAADLRGITFVNCWAASNGSQGVYIGANVEGFQFIGGKVLNNGQNGFTVTSTTATRITIADNLIVSNSQGSSGTYSGIRVVGGATHVTITGNHSYNGLSLGSTQKYGLSLDAGATDYLVIDGNDFSGNATGEINDLATGTHVHGDDVTHWEPVQFDDGSAEWPFVYLDGQIVMAEVRT